MHAALLTLLLSTPAQMQFPPVHGRTLNGQDVVVPASFPGKAVFVCLGFTRQSQYEVEPWAAVASEMFRGDARFVVVQMPMYSGFARVVRPFIDRGMASATPPTEHGHVITSVDTDAAVDGLQLGDKARAAMVLVAPDGRVRFLARGKPTPQSTEEFRQAVSGLQQELSTPQK